jgi:hypothetical protein
MKGNRDAAGIMAIYATHHENRPFASPQQIDAAFAALEVFEENLDLVFLERITRCATRLTRVFEEVHYYSQTPRALQRLIRQIYKEHTGTRLPSILAPLRPIEVAFSPFSISVVLNKKRFRALAHSPGVHGLHIKGTALNFIRDSENPGALAQCIEHEEYHGLCEGAGVFGHCSPLQAFEELSTVVKLAYRMIEYSSDDLSKELEHRVHSLLKKNSAAVFLDLAHEELLTDFRSVQRVFRNPSAFPLNNVQNPFSSFLTYWSELSEHIARISATGVPAIARYGRRLCSEVDSLWPKIFDNYTALQAGCSTVDPEDARFTEALMHLFPPSQIHIAARICEREIRNFPRRGYLGIQTLGH